jgi:hypothetical protein
MIVRDFSFDVIDSTTNTYQPFDRRTDTLILAPLDRYKIRIKDRYFVVIEPLQGNLDDPDPNAFVTAYSGSWTSGNTFSLNLLGQDFEQEGFAIGDEVFVLLHWAGAFEQFRCTIIGLNGASATFRIIQWGGTIFPNIQFPLRATIILLSDRSELKPSFHFGNNSGPNSPLSAIPFTSPHADHIIAYSSANPSDLPTPLTYNLQKYSSLEPTIVSLGTLLLDYSPLDFRRRAIIVEGTQFYAYRTNLDPQAQAPTSLYSLDGRIEVLLQAPTPVRDAPLSFPCLLLHPNRKGRTLNFLSPGTLTIAGGNYTLTPPSGFTPIRSVLAVTGRDSDHPRQDIPDSLTLTNPVTGASGSVPTITNRPGAEFVGVMIGQDGGKWVAVMTNKEPAGTPLPGAFSVLPHKGPIFRYDSLIGLLNVPDLPAGIYIVQTLLKIGSTFVPIDEVEYNPADLVNNPFPPAPPHKSRSNIYPLDLISTFARGFQVKNYDLDIRGLPPSVFSVFVPSCRKPPTISSALTQPSGGYGLDLNNWIGGAITLKWRLFTPDGAVYDSNELTFPTTYADDTMRFEPDGQLAIITETATEIMARHPSSSYPNDGVFHTYIRAAIFVRPEKYKPIMQSMFYVVENFSSMTVLQAYSEGVSAIAVSRSSFDFRSYAIIIDKTTLPPGQYTLHVRHSVRKEIFLEYKTIYWDSVEDESYFYDFTIPAPPEPPSGPPLAPDFCIPKIPAVAGEDWNGLYRDGNGEWQAFATILNTCHLDNYCTCFELVSEVPAAYIDIIGYFKGAVSGKPVPAGAKHKARFIGQIKRIADQYESESFISSAYAAEDIVRAYSERFEMELLIFDPCQLSHVDLLKFAEKCDVVNRSNRLLPSEIRNLKFEEVNIENDPKYARVRITLRRVKWREEYRRNA